MAYVTSSPTHSPSVSPSSRPSTTVPSAPPTVTGLVATVTASTLTTEALDNADVAAYVNNVAEYYGVDVDDVTTTVVYSTTGTMVVSVPDGVTAEELSDAVQDSIASSLGVHPQNVEVEVNLETGEVTFTVLSDDYAAIQEAQFNLERDVYQDAIVSSLTDAVPALVIDSLTVSEETTATIEFTVDANEASNDMTQAAWQTEQLFSEEFDVEIQSKPFSFCEFSVLVMSQLCYNGPNWFPFSHTIHFHPFTSAFHYWSCGNC